MWIVLNLVLLECDVFSDGQTHGIWLVFNLIAGKKNVVEAFN